MKKNVEIIVANPAGNITIFVLDKFERSHYQSVATQLLSKEELKGEQVAFILGENKMEMCGLEFCGNASRSFALLIAKDRGIKGYAHIDVDVSGSDEILTVAVDTENNYTKIKMPLPLSVKTLKNTAIDFLDGGQLVDFGGIMHAVLKNVPPTQENFDVIKEYINEKYDPPAMGVMFYDAQKSALIPVVYVKDVNTTYFEGSCGSGTTAAAVAFSNDEESGTFSFTLPQPAGTITSTVEKSRGKVDAVYIEGLVSFSAPMAIEIEI